MEKKRFNWLGWLSILILVPPELFLIYLSVKTNSDDVLGFAVFGFMGAVVLISIFWKIGWRLVLPNKRAWAKLVHKRVAAPGFRAENTLDTVLHFFLTFEFLDGSRVSYSAPLSLYKKIPENEVGILTYKDQGKTGFFVNFEKQN